MALWKVALLLFIASVHADDGFIFPDQYEKMSRRNQYAYNYQPTPPPQFPTHSITSGQTGPENIGASRYAPGPLSDRLTPFWSNHVNNIISRGMLKFALDMDRAISSNSTQVDHRNVVFSPLSLAGTMAMVLLASGGRTFDEIARILGLQSGVDISGHSEIVHQMLGSFISQINMQRAPGEPVASYASGIFVQQGYPIRPEFETISKNVYKSDVMNLDFQNQARRAQDTINSWVKDRTGGKIANILEDVHPATKVILASALYFIGEWNEHFYASATKKQSFFVEPGLSVEIDMMYNGGMIPFYEDEELGVKILGIPYKGKEVTMYILLPTVEGATALKRFEQNLTPEIIERLIGNMRKYTCIFALPKMKLSSNLGLKDALKSLGLTTLFDHNAADLSLLSPGSGESPIMSRLGDEEDPPQPEKSSRINQINYVDEKGGYKVEQWNSGFDLSRILGNDSHIRRRRQNRPIDQDFLNYVNSLNLPNFGLDNLRNSHRTVNPGLYADDVIHKVEININEKGVEAAAATAATIKRGGDIKRFIPDRPFLFFIRHDPSKLVWFWGTVNKPEPNFQKV